MSIIKKAVIPAAGLGTRFLPATKAIPKEMIPIIDIPMIQFIVEEAVRSGVEDIILITARGKESIENHFDFNPELEAHLDQKGKKELADLSRSIGSLCKFTAIRQKTPMGLGHAVLCAESAIGKEPFAVLLGDDLIDSEVPCIQQLTEVFKEHQKSVVGVMEVAQSEVSKYGIIGGAPLSKKLTQVKEVVEKPAPALAPSRLAIPGRYVLSPKIFEYLKKIEPGNNGEIQLTDGLHSLAQREGLLAFQFDGDRYDTGDRMGYLDATLNFALRRSDLKKQMLPLLQKYLKLYSQEM